MPPFYVALKLGARVEDIIEVVLVVNRPCQTISEHPLGQGWQRLRGIFAKVGGGRPRGLVLWGLELEELVLGCAERVSIKVALQRKQLRQVGAANVPPAMAP